MIYSESHLIVVLLSQIIQSHVVKIQSFSVFQFSYILTFWNFVVGLRQPILQSL